MANMTVATVAQHANFNGSSETRHLQRECHEPAVACLLHPVAMVERLDPVMIPHAVDA
jgi:hypothetical protein